MPAGVSPKRDSVRALSEPWLVPMRIATPRSLHLRTSGVKIFSISRISASYSSSVSYRMSSNFLRPSAKLPGLTRILSKHSATVIATLGAKWMSAMSGVVYPFSRSVFLISTHAFASCMPCTVMRTISAPASAHLITCSSFRAKGTKAAHFKTSDRSAAEVDGVESGSRSKNPPGDFAWEADGRESGSRCGDRTEPDFAGNAASRFSSPARKTALRPRGEITRGRRTSATVASTSRVSEVVMVWRTMGCSEPSLTSPMVTVLRRKEGRDVSRGRQARAVANAR